MLLLLSVYFSEMPPQQQACYVWWGTMAEKTKIAFHCDIFGQRSNYA